MPSSAREHYYYLVKHNDLLDPFDALLGDGPFTQLLDDFSFDRGVVGDEVFQTNHGGSHLINNLLTSWLSMTKSRPENIGILALEIYHPSLYVGQAELGNCEFEFSIFS